MRLGMLLAAPPGGQDAETVRRLAAAALARGWEVRIFLTYRGVLAGQALAPLAGSPGAAERLQVHFCSHNAEEYGHEPPPPAAPGSQYDWARIVDWAEKVMVFA